MKICHLSALQVWPMEGRGGMPSLRETLRGYVQAGDRVELIVPRYDLFSDDAHSSGIREGKGYKVHVAECRWFPLFSRVRATARRLSGGDAIAYPARWILNLGMLFCLTISLYIKARSVCGERFVPDAVYAHNQYAALAGLFLRCVWGVPNVTRLYGTFLADLMKKPLVAVRYPTAAAGFLVPSSLLICGNDGTRGDEVARRLGIRKERFRFWQNGVEPPENAPAVTRGEFVGRFAGLGLRPECKWAISCSRVTYWKRIDRMIRALPVAKAAGCGCQLLIAGTGAEEDKLRSRARELGVSPDVVWLGAMAHDAIWELMHVADVFMITNDVTNRCNPLYEAAWAGLPVVSVFDPSTADLLKHGENALLGEKEDTDTLGRNLAAVCRDPGLAEKLSQAQSQLASSFWTWEERMKVEVEELERLVARAGEKG